MNSGDGLGLNAALKSRLGTVSSPMEGMKLTQEEIAQMITDLKVTAVVQAGCDTLEDIPDVSMTTLTALDMMVLQPFRNMIGVLLDGPMSMQFPSAVSWGSKVMKLSGNEFLQMRVSPKGVIGQSDYTGVVVISTRIFNPNAEAKVSTLIVWNMQRTQVPDADVTAGGSGNNTIGTRNQHMLLPSIFSHHDTIACLNGEEGNSGKWVILDSHNCHAVKPSTFTVMRSEQYNERGGIKHVCSTTPGMSTYVVAGALLGHDMEDQTKRSAERIKYRDWQLQTGNAMHSLEAVAGPSRATDATNASLAILDLLSPEGLLGMLSNFNQVPLPDMMHVSSGLPLLIAASMRIAAKSEKYNDLCDITQMDRVAINEITSIFESSRAPITDVPVKTWAIDIVLRNGLNEARAAAKSQNATIAVQDNLLFFQRMAVRCATATFGATERRDNPKNWKKSRYGNLSSRVIDPIEEARLRVLAKHNLMDTRPSSTAQSGQFFGTGHAELKSTLLTLMDMVEESLRTGKYGEIQVHKTNDTNPDFEEVEGIEEEYMAAIKIGKENDRKKKLRRKQQKADLKAKYDPETRERVKAMLKSNEGSSSGLDANAFLSKELESWCDETEERDKLAALALEVIMSGDSSSSGDEDAEAAGKEVEETMAHRITKDDVLNSPKTVEMKIRQVLCVDAVMHANGLLAAAFCQGPSVHHQLNVGAFLVSPHALSQCADCSEMVHVTTSLMLQRSHAACWRCKRRRCVKCRLLSLEKALKAAQSQRVPSRQPCRRCGCKPAPTPVRQDRKVPRKN